MMTPIDPTRALRLQIAAQILATMIKDDHFTKQAEWLYQSGSVSSITNGLAQLALSYATALIAVDQATISD